MHPGTYRTPGDSTVVCLRVRRLGRRGYADGCALQEHAARSVGDGGPDELLFVEHDAVITLGRGTTADQLLASREELAAAGIAIRETDRGGGATYHGPGQIIGYPIVDLRRRAIGVRTYLRALEAALVGALGPHGVDAYVRPGLTGVWADEGKLASIGIAVRRGVTRHGFALNVSPDLDAFRRIVPCGLPYPVTSLRELGWDGSRAVLCGSIGAGLEALLGALPPGHATRMDERGADDSRLAGVSAQGPARERAISHA